MTPAGLSEVSSLNLDEVKKLCSASGPCISVYLNAGHSLLKNAMREVEAALTEKHVDPKQTRDLLEPLKSLAASGEALPKQGGLVIFRAADVFLQFHTPSGIPDSVAVGDHFLIRPLLPLIGADHPFYLLGLSQKHIRLLRCTTNTSDEVALPDSLPKSLKEDKHTDQPDHNQEGSSSGGPSTGSMRGVMFSTNTDREAHEQYLRQFYKDVNHAVKDCLKHETAPLVLAGVDYELALYRTVNTYEHLAEAGVHGSADGLKGPELHKRALEAVQPALDLDLQNALKSFNEHKGASRATHTVKEIVPAAFDGRVLALILSETGHYSGNFDEATHQVRGHKSPLPGDEDLLNAAAVQTLLHSGKVFVVPASKVPDGAPAAAVMRY